jgi:hypothetical protein
MGGSVPPGSRATDNNEDLYEFLLRLAEELQAHGEAQLAKEVIFASRFASGLASEVLHSEPLPLVSLQPKLGVRDRRVVVKVDRPVAPMIVQDQARETACAEGPAEFDLPE